MTVSGSKVNQFVHVPTSVDMQHFIQIYARVFETDRQTDRQTDELERAGENIYMYVLVRRR